MGHERTLYKHRTETEVFSVDLQNPEETNVGDGETVSTPSVKIMRWDYGEYVDVSAEFHLADVQIANETEVQFTTGKAAAAGEQKQGMYVVRAQAVTNVGRELTETPDLIVGDEGDDSVS